MKLRLIPHFLLVESRRSPGELSEEPFGCIYIRLQSRNQMKQQTLTADTCLHLKLDPTTREQARMWVK